MVATVLARHVANRAAKQRRHTAPADMIRSSKTGWLKSTLQVVAGTIRVVRALRANSPARFYMRRNTAPADLEAVRRKLSLGAAVGAYMFIAALRRRTGRSSGFRPQCLARYHARRETARVHH
ncbi:hypothetical protein PsYK624_151890 [Phanerochaete sordida]|uniref:Uncharacterized protein n=1 Tax=Phanerochaete sordida TaxID=48140 RepID=A0A9P3LKW6_9APHY|nr:hypothetical protein PsYK624_151890 [Phanerochaete sordida]